MASSPVLHSTEMSSWAWALESWRAGIPSNTFILALLVLTSEAESSCWCLSPCGLKLCAAMVSYDTRKALCIMSW